jgi:hypothetical protein
MPQRHDPSRVTPPRQDKRVQICAIGDPGCEVRATGWVRVAFGASGVLRRVPACDRCAASADGADGR